MTRNPENTLLETADGSLTVRHGLLGELYHSDRGAVGEAEHVYIGAGLKYQAGRGLERVSVFEVGFGTGLNCLLTARFAREAGLCIDYRAVELYPLDMETACQLNYATDEPERQFLESLHRAEWEKPVAVSENFTLTKYLVALEDLDPAALVWQADVVYFDAFAPDAQPELWSPQIMRRMYRLLRPGGVLVTYSAKGIVKRALTEAGFDLYRLPGALGKRHMLRGVKTG